MVFLHYGPYRQKLAITKIVHYARKREVATKRMDLRTLGTDQLNLIVKVFMH